jgi:hypothetical protein
MRARIGRAGQPSSGEVFALASRHRDGIAEFSGRSGRQIRQQLNQFESDSGRCARGHVTEAPDRAPNFAVDRILTRSVH